MSEGAPLLLIQDMIEAIDKIERYTYSMDFEEFRERNIVVDAYLT